MARFIPTIRNPSIWWQLWETEPKPSRASDDYVRETFDNFAEDFDRQLLEDLEYRAPKLIHALFGEIPGATTEKLADILDAGCGTGLSGLDFKPHAATLTGVDLSLKCLNGRKNGKSTTKCLSLSLPTVCEGRPAAFDLIVAADVFCYIGDLSETLDAALNALKPGGHLLFFSRGSVQARVFADRFGTVRP